MLYVTYVQGAFHYLSYMLYATYVQGVFHYLSYMLQGAFHYLSYMLQGAFHYLSYMPILNLIDLNPSRPRYFLDDYTLSFFVTRPINPGHFLGGIHTQRKRAVLRAS